jgi:SAM-dependent methyltransferase
MRTLPAPDCPVCGRPGVPLHRGLRDALFGAGGEWSLSRCADAACGVAWLDPRPAREDLARAYADYYTHAAPVNAPPRLRKRAFLAARRGYLASRFGYGAGVGERALGWLLRLHPDLPARIDLEAFHLPASARGRFLEIGCGSGEHLAAMAELGWEVQGIDVDPAAVEAARARGLDVACGELAGAGLRATSFAAIGMSHVIEHVDDPDTVLRECRRLLAPGGRLVLVTPNIESFGHARYGRHWLSLDPPRHLRLYTPAALERVVRAAGFASVAARTGVREAHNGFLASRAIARSGRWQWGARGTLGERVACRALQTWARLRLLVRPAGGEEIVVQARA